MSTELKINPVYKYHLPPLSQDVYNNLKNSIIANGCVVPIVVWEGTIVDGHNRYEICQELGIPFEVREEHFNSEAEVLLWISAQQLTRRNLTDVERVVQALKEKPTLIAIGKRKQGFRSDLHHLAGDGSHNTRDIIAKMAGVKSWLVGDIEYITAHGDASLQKQVLTGEIAPSTAKQIIRGEKWKAEQERLDREEAKKQVQKAVKEQMGVIIPFPKQPYQANLRVNDNVEPPDVYYGQKDARKQTVRQHGVKMNTKYPDDDDQYLGNNKQNQHVRHLRHDRSLQNRDSLSGSSNEHSRTVNLADINTGPSMYSMEYIRGQFQRECDSLLSNSNRLLNQCMLEGDRTEENIGEIREIVTECFNAILSSLDDARIKANEAKAN